jgi:hypothetical protein
MNNLERERVARLAALADQMSRMLNDKDWTHVPTLKHIVRNARKIEKRAKEQLKSFGVNRVS